ncbi:MAG: M23 family metallopeptidase [Kofleriaceae bacterium]
MHVLAATLLLLFGCTISPQAPTVKAIGPLPDIDDCRCAEDNILTRHRPVRNGKFVSGHIGVDFLGRAGASVVAIGDGVVTVVFGDDADINHGSSVLVDHTSFLYTHYLMASYVHLEQVIVTEGQRVTRGQVIGRIWGGGDQWPSHVHLTIDTSGPVEDEDPLRFVRVPLRCARPQELVLPIEC